MDAMQRVVIVNAGLATWRVGVAIRVLGVILIALSLATVTVSALLYAQLQPFSLFTTYLSDMGNTPPWPQALFNGGMLVGTPLRFLFLLLLVSQLLHLGAGRAFAVAALLLGAANMLANVAMFVVPFGLARSIHMTAAMIAFFGTVALFLLLAAKEWRLRLPALLPVASLLGAMASLVFATLLSMVGRLPGVTRETPVIWEWLVFVAFMFWSGTHLVLLGRDLPPGRP